MSKIDEAKELIDRIKKIALNLRQELTDEAYKMLDMEKANINNYYIELINMIPMLKEEGVDIPENIVLEQLKNLVDGLEYRDTVLLADTLEYEIIDTLTLYIEILEQI